MTNEIPGPRPDEVLVRTSFSTISPGTERANFRLEAGTPSGYPILPGYSLAGEVAAVGRRVSDLVVGDLVATQAPHASAVTRPADLVYRLPEGVGPAQGAFLYLGMIVLHGLLRIGVEKGTRVAVLGRGTIGLLAVQLCRALDAAEVVSVAPSGRRVTAGLRRSADRIVVTDDDGENGLDALDADIVIEASGVPETLSTAIRMCRQGGRIGLLGSPRRQARDVDFGAIADRALDLIGGHISTLTDPPPPGRPGYGEVARRFLELVGRGEVDIDDLVAELVDPWECGRFYRDLGRRRPDWPAALLRWEVLPDHERLSRRAPWSPPDMELVRGMRFDVLPLERHVERGASVNGGNRP